MPSKSPLPENLEDIRDFVNGEGRFYIPVEAMQDLSRTPVREEYGFDPDDVNWNRLITYGYDEDTIDDFFQAASDTLYQGRDLKEYLKSDSAVRLVYVFTEYVPANPNVPISQVINDAAISVEDTALLRSLLNISPKFKAVLESYFPKFTQVLKEYSKAVKKFEKETLDDLSEQDNILEYTFDKMMESFSNGKGDFTWVGSDKFKDTGELISDFFVDRPNTPPELVLPWEMRIGGSKFSVPPISINVNQSFKAGSLSGGAIRQMNTPKFNSGYSETTVDVTIYFPNQESIWGFEGDSLTIDLADNPSDEVLDKYLSSLRGLVTQFKYAPFLPIKNQYLNQVYDITAVALESLTVSTVENFPFCLAVNLRMTKFNHKPFLPTIRDFNSAIHWGRFRQYMFAAAQHMNKVVNRGFLVEREVYEEHTSPAGEKYAEKNASSETVIEWEYPESLEFNKITDFHEGKHLEIYFPSRTPARVFFPEYSMFRAVGEDTLDSGGDKGVWGNFLAALGYDPASKDLAYEKLKDQNLLEDRTSFVSSDRKMLSEFLADKGISNDLKETFLEDWKKYYVDATKNDRNATPVEYLTETAALIWYEQVFNEWLKLSGAEQRKKDKDEASGKVLIKEWLVPMTRAGIDWDKVFVTGVTTTIGNNFARLQLQMDEDPAMQHIGGLDSQINVNMVVFGESELIKWKRMFSHVSGLAMLEHAHGVLGFLGIKNIVTALCGIKYTLPLDFNVETIPGFPNVYNVSMSFVDFDVEQQKREELSNEQQAFLTSQFSKRNPFLRIKQSWGAFNSYPDFPLSVTDDEGNVIGHLDPDYYFRAFDTWDDDLLKHDTSGFRDSYEIQSEISAIDDLQKDVSIGYRRTDEDYFKEVRNKLYQEKDITRYFEIQNELDNFEERNRNLEGKFRAPKREALLEERNAIIKRLGNNVPSYSGEGGLNAGPVAGKVSGAYADRHKVRWSFGVYGEEQKDINVVEIEGSKINLGSLNKETKKYSPIKNGEGIELIDQNPDRFLTQPFTEGLTPLSDYQNAYIDGSKSNATSQYEQIAYDARYRDVSGRMLRAFPTYMLWLIDEGGRFAGYKLFDNFYGLQSVIDFSIVQSEDILGDTLVLRLSNLYKKLTTPASEYYDFAQQGEEGKTSYTVIDSIYRDAPRNVNSGTLDNYLVDLNNIRLKPGVRLHLRMGYGSNPNALQTVFNGVITSVSAGEIVEVVAQSDAIELSAIVNTTNEKGHSGKVDGALFTGAWLSEPRDLMIKLLTMGSSQFREAYANATEGKIFSENKWGIRHFGSVLYDTMTDDEAARQETYAEGLKEGMGDSNKEFEPPVEDGGAGVSADGSAVGETDPTLTPMATNKIPGNDGSLKNLALEGGRSAIRYGALTIITGLFDGLETKRDFEIFKRNIYPGNGTGIAQFLGADSMNGGDILAATDDKNVAQFLGEVTAANTEDIPSGGGSVSVNGVTVELTSVAEIGDNIRSADAFGTSLQHGYAISGSSDKLKNYNRKRNLFHGIANAMGLARGEDEDSGTNDEVSFRASTYMKSVWDLFQTCAALLPNYVVAVRPFEDRSTVFYGKPHWLYTSGVIPLSTGVPNDGSEGAPKYMGPDQDLKEILEKLADLSSSLSDAKDQLSAIENSAVQQSLALGGTGVGEYNGRVGVEEISVTVDGKEYTLSFPFVDQAEGRNLLGVEMHLPTKPGTSHMQVPGLPEKYKFPYYMDRVGGERGGRQKNYAPPGSGKSVLGEEGSLGGQHGAFGYLDPEDEQYYINMRWDYSSGKSAGAPDPLKKDGRPRPPQKAYYKRRVLVVNKETGLACVCSVGEYGPAYGDVVQKKNMPAGASPDTHFALGNIDMKHGIPCTYSWVPDSTPLGPTSTIDFDNSTNATNVESNDGFETNKKTGLSGAIDKVTSVGEAILNDPNRTKVEVSIDAYNKTINEKAYNHYATGWYEAKSPWNDPWGSEFGDSLDKFANRSSTDIYTDEVIEAIKEKDWEENSPFGPDPVSIAARRYYDKEYNDRVSEVEEFLVKKEFEGFTNNKATYDVSNNFTNSDGSPLESGRGMDEAKNIWNQFRSEWLYFRTYRENIEKDDFFDVGYEVELARKEHKQIFSTYKLALESGPKPPVSIFPDPRLFIFDRDTMDAYIEEGLVKDEEEFKKHYNKTMGYIYDTIEEFATFMWQNPYARAWLVITTEGKGGTDLSGSSSNNYDFSKSPVVNAFQKYLSIRGARPGEAITDNPVGGKLNAMQGELLGWLEQNNKKGGGVGGIDDIITESVGAMGDKIGKIVQAMSIGFGGLFSLFEQALGTYGEALERTMAMQKRANILNAAYNDSIYYAAGAPGSLARLADNPFTREYGEPVVEIREPFQRLHYFNSFQHILSNGIQETLEEVYTTITVTSDGNYPITVFFDKGAPPERQVEGFAESGIYWDNAKGSGFFGFLHPVLNPLETVRGLSKIAFGSSDELSARRIGIYHLKESLKDIYQGELIVMGNADVRPWDLVYLGDVYEAMYGLFEVEQVVHHFTPETGFITSITPNAVVMANDPSRWVALSWLNSWMGVKNVRDDVRNLMLTRASESSPLARGEMTLEDLTASLRKQTRGQTQYTHGSAAMQKDMAGHFASGLAYRPGEFSDKPAVQKDYGAATQTLVGSNTPFLNIFSEIAWDAWEWTKDLLSDQQDCYISYLTKDGQPMDAGLSFNSGVAVGSHHSYALLPGILGLNLDVKKDGKTRITIEDLLGNLGYNERDIISIRRNTSLWVSKLSSQILKIAGTGPDQYPFSDFNAYIGTVKSITDGDTIKVTLESGEEKSLRLSGIDTAELAYYASSGNGQFDSIPNDNPGLMAKNYLESRIPVGTTVAIRESLSQEIKTYGRTAAVIFHNVPTGITDEEERKRILLSYAGRGSKDSPSSVGIAWDSYLDDGRPFTINWEMIMAGHSPLNYTVFASSKNEASRGASPINPVEGGN